jgi:hypothetical protein
MRPSALIEMKPAVRLSRLAPSESTIENVTGHPNALELIKSSSGLV